MFNKLRINSQDSIIKLSFTLTAISALVMFTLLITRGNDFYGLLSGYIFLILWSCDKVLLWFLDRDFGINASLKIKKSAPRIIRLLGASFALFALYIGCKGLIEHVFI